jgi:hypothetical protein
VSSGDGRWGDKFMNFKLMCKLSNRRSSSGVKCRGLELAYFGNTPF